MLWTTRTNPPQIQSWPTVVVFEPNTGLFVNAINVTIDDAATNTASDVAVFKHNTSGNPAAGFGSTVRFKLESTTTQDQDAVALSVVWSDPTHATRTSNYKIQVVDQGAALSDAIVIAPIDFSGSRGISLGVNCTPLRAFHLKVNHAFSGILNLIALENAATTDGSGANITMRTTTTGAGGATFQGVANIGLTCDIHDHATRQGKVSMFVQNGATAETTSIKVGRILEFDGIATIKTTTGKLTLATGAANGDIDVTPHGTGVIKFNGTQILGARKTGWTAATGTKSRATFVTDTALPAAIGAALGALIDDLTTHGLIGA